MSANLDELKGAAAKALFEEERKMTSVSLARLRGTEELILKNQSRKWDDLPVGTQAWYQDRAGVVIVAILDAVGELDKRRQEQIERQKKSIDRLLAEVEEARSEQCSRLR